MIFLADTPKDIKSGYSYVINRDEDRYTILEGDIKLFDKISFDLKARGITDSPYDTLVLSFEEEDLTLDEIMEIYYDWKELYLGSYDPDEYYLFSVVHWDDDHPHIHIGVINRSMVNEKQLRMTRYGIDNKESGRNGAIQEIINYKYRLKSPIGEKWLYQTTREQKKRDWEVGKGKPFYEVEDDRIYSYFRGAVRQSKDFGEFLSMVEARYGKVEIKKEFEEEVVINIGGRRYKSLLFNEVFFNEHIDEIKKGVDRFEIGGLRKDENHYLELYDEKNEKHSSELERRNIHEGLLEHKLNKGELGFLKDAISIDDEFDKIKRLKNYDIDEDGAKIEEIIKSGSNYIFCLDDFKLFLKYCGMSVKDYGETKGDGWVVIKKDDKEIKIYDNGLFEVCKTNRYDKLYFEKINRVRVDKIKDKIDKLPINKRENIEIIKMSISDEIIERNIMDRASFEAFLNAIGVEKVNDGYSVSRGGYITLNIKGKKVAFYDDMMYGYYHDDINDLPTRRLGDINFNGSDLDDLPNDALKSSLCDIIGGEAVKPESVYEFKLKYIEDVGLRVVKIGAKQEDINLNFDVKRDRKAKAVIYDKGVEIDLKKSLSHKDGTDAVIGVMEKKDWKSVRLSGCEEYQKSLIYAMSYLSATRKESADWIDDILIESDVSENILNINKGEIFEIVYDHSDIIDIIEDDRIKVIRDNKKIGDDISQLRNNEEVKADFVKKIDLEDGRKISVKSFVLR